MPYRLKTPEVGTGLTDPSTAQLFHAARTSLGFVPNNYKQMARFPPLLEAYRLGYARMRSGSFTGAEQEVIFLTASLSNGCAYCVAEHSTLATEDYAMAPDELARLRRGEALKDRKLEALRAFTAEMIETHGQPDAKLAESFLKAGYTEAQMFEIILAIALKTMSNLSGRLSRPEPDPRFAPNA